MRKLVDQTGRDSRQTESEKEAAADEELPTQHSPSSTLGDMKVGDLSVEPAEPGRAHSIASQSSQRPATAKSLYEGNPYDIDRVNTRSSFKE